jgi:hypothetical protein
MTLNWENLKEDGCPACGYAMEQEKTKWVCKNHKGNPFIIPYEKVIEIKRSLQEKEDFAFPQF